MQRPSNLIIAFVMAIAGIFLFFVLGRIALFILPDSDTEIEVESDFESRQEHNQFIAQIK